MRSHYNYIGAVDLESDLGKEIIFNALVKKENMVLTMMTIIYCTNKGTKKSQISKHCFHKWRVFERF